jgi:hypothetical protein
VRSSVCVPVCALAFDFWVPFTKLTAKFDCCVTVTVLSGASEAQEDTNLS